MIVAVAMVVGCGPEAEPPVGESGSGSVGSSSTSEDTTTEPSQSSGEPAPETTSSGSSTGSSSADSTGSTGEVAECPPRELPEDEVWFLTFIQGRVVYPAPAQADCMFDEILGAPDSTDLVLSCSFPDGTNDAMTLHFDLEVDLTGSPLSPGMPLTWTRTTELGGFGWERHSMGLRDVDGALVLGIFQGWEPGDSAGAAAELDPVALELIRGLCEPPCKPLGCVARTAIDVSVAGSEAVRIYDGTTAVAGEDPAFRTYVITAQDGLLGLDAPDSYAEILLIRVSP
jgi:hypothetical protein